MVSESVSVNMDQFHDTPSLAHRIVPGQALTRWEMSEPEEIHFPGQPRPMPDKVNYCFINGWVDTGDLPCREALYGYLARRQVDIPKGPFDKVHWGLDGDEVDYSAFKHRPTLVRRSFRCRVVADRAGPATFRITTCGGVNIWLNEDRVASFEPFRRNAPESSDVVIDFPEGKHTLTLLLEDLHERDTVFFFSLKHLSGPSLEVSLDVGVDGRKLAEAGKFLAGLRTDTVFSSRGRVRLIADTVPSSKIDVEVSGPTAFPRGGLNSDPSATPETRHATFRPDELVADLFEVGEAPVGCLAVDLTAVIDGIRLSRRLGMTNLPEPFRLAGSLSERKAQAAQIMTSARGFEPSVAALLAIRNEDAPLVSRIVEATLATIEQRYDCSDFSILPLLRLWRDGAGQLPSGLRDRLRAGFLGYRYWLDAPGNDVMWFWSENHVLCFHAAQLIAGDLFPDEIFPAHGKRGSELAAEAESRLNRWFDAIDEDGLCEWNSAAYYPIDFLGLFSLHDMAPTLRGRASAVLDRIFVMTGLHSTGGVPAGTQGRAYEKELLAGPVTELGSVAAIAFGGDFWTGHDRAAALFCLSAYEPPAEAARFAAPSGDGAISARYTQGYGHAGKLTLWKSSEAQLSTVTDLRTGEKGHQAHVLDVQFAAHPMARFWINHPGELKVWGERRPSLLAGNHVMPAVAQHGPTALAIYDLRRDWTDLFMTQLFAPAQAFDDIEQHQNWLLFRSGSGWAGIWCSHELSPVGGLYQGALRRAHAQCSAWVVSLSRPDETDEQFRNRLMSRQPEFDPQRLNLSARGAKDEFLSLTLGDPLRVDGDVRVFAPLSSVPHVAYDDAPLKPWKLHDA